MKKCYPASFRKDVDNGTEHVLKLYVIQFWAGSKYMYHCTLVDDEFFKSHIGLDVDVCM